MNKFKSIAHVLAIILGAFAVYLSTPQGISLIHQIPSIAPVAAAIAIAATYFSPKVGT